MTPLTKHTLLLREGDFAFLKERFSTIGASSIIRRLTSDFVDKLSRPLPDKDMAKLVKEFEVEEKESTQ